MFSRYQRSVKKSHGLYRVGYPLAEFLEDFPRDCMKILPDECVPERFRRYIPGHDAHSANYAGFA